MPPQSDTAAGRGAVAVIVGRPNVGKSALFNRLAGERIAIVFDQPGVTRDRVAREIELRGRRLMLVDTGGIAFGKSGASASADPLAAETRAQAELGLGDASVCIFAVDARAGATPLDEEVFELVRCSGVKCLVAANKCDNPPDDELAHEFARFGAPVFPVSAEHNRGIPALAAALCEALPETENASVADPLRVAVAGRPNAGKSSFINRLLNAPRVIVSDIAGTTRDSVDVPFTIGSGPDARHYMLVDTAGMKPRARASSSSIETFSGFRSEKAIEGADVAVLVIDASQGPCFQDKRIAGMILEKNKSCAILVSKWDLAREKGMTETKALPALRAMMPFLSFAPVVFCSAKDGYNIRRTIDAIDRAAVSASMRLPTGVLNRAIAEAARKTQCPQKNGRRLKIYYAVQVGVRPQTVRLFVNDSSLATPQYLAYLERSIRARFGLEGAPLRIVLKDRPRGAQPADAQRRDGGKTCPGD